MAEAWSRARLLSALLALAPLACEGSETTVGQPTSAASTTPDPPSAPPPLVIAGCSHLEASRCHLPADKPGDLRVWIDARTGADTIEASLDGRPLGPLFRPVGGGLQLRIEIGPDAKRLELSAPTWTEARTLEFVHEPTLALIDQLKARFKAGEPGVTEELRAAADAAEGLERLALLQLLRHLVASEGTPDMFEVMETTANFAEQLGRSWDFADVGGAVIFYSRESEPADFARARRWARRIEAHVAASEGPLPGELAVWADYYNGLVSYAAGDYNAALREFQAARLGGERLALAVEHDAAREHLATIYAELGRREDFHAIARELRERSQDPKLPCTERGRILGNLAGAHLARPHEELDLLEVRELLTAQLAAVGSEGECPRPTNAALARINFALTALAETELDEAQAWVDAARFSAELPPPLLPWVEELDAQLGLETGRWDVLPPIVARPSATKEPALRWNSMVRQARTLARFDFVDAAVAAHLDAETLLEGQLARVGVDEGRELYLASKRDAQAELVELLVARGRVDEAWCRARLARGRALRSVDRVARIDALPEDQRREREAQLFAYLALQDELERERADDWRHAASVQAERVAARREREREATRLLVAALATTGSATADCASLPAPIPGQLSLMLVGRPDQGAWLFAADDTRVEAHPVPIPGDDPAAWAALALEPLTARLANATAIRVIETSLDATLDYHALPYGEGLLLDHAPVVYALDLPSRPHPADPASTSSQALVLADPKVDLPLAREEARLVATALAASGWTVVRQLGAQVTRTRSAAALAEARLFHYAGHGRPGTGAGWDAAFVLHEGELVTASDLLALPRVPAQVVLAGCDTATPLDETLAGGMSLARAFVLAGSDWVIAAHGKVDDTLARGLAQRLYANLEDEASGLDGPAALREAQLGLRREQPDGGWPSFRVVVP